MHTYTPHMQHYHTLVSVYSIIEGGARRPANGKSMNIIFFYRHQPTLFHYFSPDKNVPISSFDILSY